MNSDKKSLETDINNLLNCMVTELIKSGKQQFTKQESSTMECKKENENKETESNMSEYSQNFETFNRLLDSHFELLEIFKEMNKSNL